MLADPLCQGVAPTTLPQDYLWEDDWNRREAVYSGVMSATPDQLPNDIEELKRLVPVRR